MNLGKLHCDYLEPVSQNDGEQVKRKPAAHIRVGTHTLGVHRDIDDEGAEEKEARVTNFELGLICRHWAKELATMPWPPISGSREACLLPYATERLDELTGILGEDRANTILQEVFVSFGRWQRPELLASLGEPDFDLLLVMTNNPTTKGQAEMGEQVWMEPPMLGEEAEGWDKLSDQEEYPEAPVCFQDVEWDPIIIEVPFVDHALFFQKDEAGLTVFEREVMCRFWSEVFLRAQVLQEAFGESELGAGDLADYALAKTLELGKPLGFERFAAIMKEVAES